MVIDHYKHLKAVADMLWWLYMVSWFWHSYGFVQLTMLMTLSGGLLLFCSGFAICVNFVHWQCLWLYPKDYFCFVQVLPFVWISFPIGSRSLLLPMWRQETPELTLTSRDFKSLTHNNLGWTKKGSWNYHLQKEISMLIVPPRDFGSYFATEVYTQQS